MGKTELIELVKTALTGRGAQLSAEPVAIPAKAGVKFKPAADFFTLVSE